MLKHIFSSIIVGIVCYHNVHSLERTHLTSYALQSCINPTGLILSIRIDREHRDNIMIRTLELGSVWSKA